MSSPVIQVENLSKLYRLGGVRTHNLKMSSNKAPLDLVKKRSVPSKNQ